MALQDILDAIKTEADDRIKHAQSQHRQAMKDMREETERSLMKKRQLIAEQKEQRKRQLKEKAESHARMLKSKILLEKKQEFMDRFYQQAFDALCNLDKKEQETLIEHAMKHITSKGVIYPAASQEALIKKLLPDGCTLGKAIDSKGGFRFASEREEHDFTYEFLVFQLLRESTDVSVAHALFTTSAS